MSLPSHVDISTFDSPEDLESKLVIDVYNSISSSFSSTRYNIWGGTKRFLDAIPSGSSLVEVGCGNGKNLLNLSPDVSVYACDSSVEMVKICKSRGLNNVIVANNIRLPYRSNSFDYTMSVAVIHHLSTNERRKCAIEELVRITKPGGKLYIHVWATQQPSKSRLFKKLKALNSGLNSDPDSICMGNEKSTSSDYLIPWTGRPTKTTTKIYNRYYHLFEWDELVSLVPSKEAILVDGFYEKGNWTIILQKNS